MAERKDSLETWPSLLAAMLAVLVAARVALLGALLALLASS
jgi:hypothetical protein